MIALASEKGGQSAVDWWTVLPHRWGGWKREREGQRQRETAGANEKETATMADTQW